MTDFRIYLTAAPGNFREARPGGRSAPIVIEELIPQMHSEGFELERQLNDGTLIFRREINRYGGMIDLRALAGGVQQQMQYGPSHTWPPKEPPRITRDDEIEVHLTLTFTANKGLQGLKIKGTSQDHPTAEVQGSGETLDAALSALHYLSEAQ